MKYLITGGAGFIGSHLVDALINEGNKVVIYDNLSSGKKDFIKHHFLNPNFELIEEDLLNSEKLKRSMNCIDAVFHLASNSDIIKSAKDSEIDLKQGTIVTFNVLEAMRVNNVKKIIFSSSSVVYGETTISPTKESYGPLFPISFYGASKLASEALIGAYCHNFDFKAWIYRFGNIIGERPTHGIVFDFCKKLKLNPHKLEVLGDGNQSKPYVEVHDCIGAIMFGYKNSSKQINLFNLGTKGAVYVKDIAKIVIEEMGLKKVRIKFAGGKRGWPGDVHTIRLDSTKLMSLGWKPKFATSTEAFIAGVKEIVKNLK